MGAVHELGYFFGEVERKVKDSARKKIGRGNGW